MMTDTDETFQILVVDDQDMVRESLHEILDAYGYSVDEADDGKSALEVVNTKRIDLIISDLHMPGISGDELLAAIRQRDCPIPIIIVTGDPSVDSAVKCIKLGASDYIQKPFSIEKIREAVEKVRNATAVPDSSARTIRANNSGHILGGYRVLKTVAEGNMGVVFLAQKADAESGDRKYYAVKILKEGSAMTDACDEYRKRFVNEAEAASRIKHKNIVEIYECGIAEDMAIPFLVMEYIEGESLGKYIKRARKYDYRQRVEILVQVVEALAAMHAHGIYHRDIKPENIIVTNDFVVKVTDFGVASLPESDLTMTTSILGTPNYFSPEAFISAKVDHRSDIFSFGIVAYEFLVGRKPFMASNLSKLYTEIAKNPPIYPQKLARDMPEALLAILAVTLKKHVGKRYGSAQELARDFHDFLDSKSEDVLERLKPRLDYTDWL